MKLSICVLLFNLVSASSARVLSSYGCYTTIGKLTTTFPPARSIKPINADNSISRNTNIVCISLVKGAEFRSDLRNGTIVDLSNQSHGMNLVLPKQEVSTGLYGPSLEPIIISSCIRAEIILTLHSETKLDLLQPFIVFKCLEILKKQVLISQNLFNNTLDETSKVDYSTLGFGIPFSKRPYECKFDSPSFAKDGKLISHRKRQLFWTCFSKVNQLLVFTLFTRTHLSERDLICFIDDMSSMTKIAIKSPCNGIVLESKQGISSHREIFIRVECNEEELPKLPDYHSLELRNKLTRV